MGYKYYVFANWHSFNILVLNLIASTMIAVDAPSIQAQESAINLLCISELWILIWDATCTLFVMKQKSLPVL